VEEGRSRRLKTRCRITEDVQKFAAEQRVSEEEALDIGLKRKAKEFVERGADVYAKT
jgi:phosphomethylpyrimidine synthase